MNSTDKKDLIKAINDIETNKKIKDKHLNYLLQAIADLKLQEKIIKVIR